MKKILLLALTLVMALTLISCGSGPKGASDIMPKLDITGYYELTDINASDSSSVSDSDLQLLKSMGMLPYLECYDDGTALLVFLDEEETITYDSVKMVFTLNGSELPFTYEDGVITIQEGDSSMTFTAAEKPETLPDAASGNGGSDSGSDSNSNSNSHSAVNGYVISDETIVDNEYCTFKIVEAKDDSYWGFTLKVYCENKTSDKTLMFTWDDVSVNGYMADPFWADEVAAGKKANDEIDFSSSPFDEMGIDSPDEIQFRLRVYDSDDWSADYFVDEIFTIYPTGLAAKDITVPARRTAKNEVTVVNNDDFEFVILDTEDDSIWGYTLHCYVENRTDASLMFSWDNVSVNGYMMDPYWANEIPAGKRKYCDISFSTTDFEENSIETVEEIEYTLRVYDSDDWSADDYLNETFTYRP